MICVFVDSKSKSINHVRNTPGQMGDFVFVFFSIFRTRFNDWHFFCGSPQNLVVLKYFFFSINLEVKNQDVKLFLVSAENFLIESESIRLNN